MIRDRCPNVVASFCDVRNGEGQQDRSAPSLASTSIRLASGGDGFLKDRGDGLLDEARPGRPRTIDDDQVTAVIERTMRTMPADATHWSIRSMAAERPEFSHTTIRRMWTGDPKACSRIAAKLSSCRPIRCFVDQGARYRRTLPLAAQPGALVLRIDEEKPDPGARSGAAGFADDAWRT